jgi:RNA polymerase sigma-70 factor (ECF subfamily)
MDGFPDDLRPQILAYLVRLLGDRSDAEDVCQDVFLRVHGADPAGRRQARAWVYRIATNAALNVLRRRNRRRALHASTDVDGVPAATASPEQREELRRVLLAVERLPGKQRAALMQRRFQGLGYDEIAAVLGCSPAAARANVYQAVRKLREVIE